MALGYRQQRLYTYTFDLWKPARVIDPVTKAVSDERYALALSAIPGYYEPTPEFETVTLEGRTKELNIFTADVFHFEANIGAILSDAWYIQIKTPVAHPLALHWWTVQGNPKIVVSSGNRKPNFCQVYGKTSPLGPPV